ncbi:hypothetical protein Bca101_059795 [Brassica carinata]
MPSSSNSISPGPAQIYSRCLRSAPGKRSRRFTSAATRRKTTDITREAERRKQRRLVPTTAKSTAVVGAKRLTEKREALEREEMKRFQNSSNPQQVNDYTNPTCDRDLILRPHILRPHISINDTETYDVKPSFQRECPDQSPGARINSAHRMDKDRRKNNGPVKARSTRSSRLTCSSEPPDTCTQVPGKGRR